MFAIQLLKGGEDQVLGWVFKTYKDASSFLNYAGYYKDKAGIYSKHASPFAYKIIPIK